MSKPKFEDTFEVPENMLQAAVPTGAKPPIEDTLPVQEAEFTDTPMDTVSDMAVSVPQGVTSWADEIQAGLLAGPRAMTSEDPYMKLYEEEVTPIRERLKLARTRSPWASAATELGTGIASSFIPVAGAGRLMGAGGMIARGAFEGLGTAEDKASMEGVTSTGIGAGLGAGGALVSGGLKKLISSRPNAIRANVLGARTSEFQDIGIKEREAIAKELNDMGLFSKLKVEFDPEAGKYISKGKSLENIEKPAREKIQERLNSAMEAIQKKKMAILGKHSNDVVPMANIEDKLRNMAVSFSEKAGTDIEGKKKFAEGVIEKILKDLEYDKVNSGVEDTTVALIEKAKQRIGEDVSHYGKALSNTPDEAKFYQNAYRVMNDTLKEHLGDSKYANFNSMQQKMLTAKADVAKAIASSDAQTAHAGWGGWFNKLANSTLGSPEAGLGMANMAEVAQKPGLKQGIQGLGLMTAEAPFTATKFVDPSINNSQLPLPNPNMAEEEQIPKGYNFSSAKPAFRTPQSVGLDMTPMEIVKARLPRTTQGLIQNKELVIAKLAASQVPSEMIDSVAQALNDDPQAVESIAPMVIMQFPQLFEKSKYQMFDGKLLDPNERAKAADATSKRTDLGSIQRAKIIDELNKNGKWLGE